MWTAKVIAGMHQERIKQVILSTSRIITQTQVKPEICILMRTWRYWYNRESPRGYSSPVPPIAACSRSSSHIQLVKHEPQEATAFSPRKRIHRSNKIIAVALFCCLLSFLMHCDWEWSSSFHRLSIILTPLSRHPRDRPSNNFRPVFAAVHKTRLCP